MSFRSHTLGGNLCESHALYNKIKYFFLYFMTSYFSSSNYIMLISVMSIHFLESILMHHSHSTSCACELLEYYSFTGDLHKPHCGHL
jgi:hypothetical protein